MARWQVEQKSWLASKSSKSFCSFGGIIRIGSPERFVRLAPSILPNCQPSSKTQKALTTFSRPSTMSSRYLYQFYQVYPSLPPPAADPGANVRNLSTGPNYSCFPNFFASQPSGPQMKGTILPL